jgi:hypothetical protein
VVGQVVDAEQFIAEQGKKTPTAWRKQVTMPYITTRDAAITLKTLGKIKKKNQEESNTFKDKPKMGTGGRDSNVLKDPVGAMTIDELEMIIREHKTIMLVSEGGHSNMRRSPFTDSLQTRQHVAYDSKFFETKNLLEGKWQCKTIKSD